MPRRLLLQAQQSNTEASTLSRGRTQMPKDRRPLSYNDLLAAVHGGTWIIGYIKIIHYCYISVRVSRSASLASWPVAGTHPYEHRLHTGALVLPHSTELGRATEFGNPLLEVLQHLKMRT
jgi:hypothetical protein